MENTAKKPTKVFRCGHVKAAIWVSTVNRDGREIETHSVKITKSYRNKDTGEWNNTERFFVEDLLKVAMVVTEVCREFGVHTYEPESDDSGEGSENDRTGDPGTKQQ